MTMTTRPIIEGFAVETADGLIFTVKGLLHPPDRVIAYLRYLPDPAGDRQREGRAYRRVYHLADQRQILTACYPAFIGHDPVLGIEVQSVPRSQISRVHDPVGYLAQLRQNGPAWPVEDEALALATLIQAASNVPWSSLGLSGSLLLGTQRPESDVDLVVYGQVASRAVHRALVRLLADGESPIRRPDQAELAALHQTHLPDTPLSFDDFCWAQQRKVNEGRFGSPTGTQCWPPVLAARAGRRASAGQCASRPGFLCPFCQRDERA